MVETIPELRLKVQAPVRKYNDVAGLLVGDRLSIHVTRAFIVLGLSPTVGTISMLVFGVVGSILAAFGGWWSVAGFACVFAYYIFDCVDGEVARYHKCEKLIWGFHDFMFHLAVKTSFFIALGIYAARATGRPWMFFFGLAALVATLWVKFLYDVALILILRYVVFRSTEERQRFVEQLSGDALPQMMDERAAAADPKSFAFGGFLSSIRTAVTNFDLSTILFLVAAIADMQLPAWTLSGIPFDAKIALSVFYGIVLPLDFIDRLQTYIRTGAFTGDARRVLRQAHHFRLRP